MNRQVLLAQMDAATEREQSRNDERNAQRQADWRAEFENWRDNQRQQLIVELRALADLARRCRPVTELLINEALGLRRYGCADPLYFTDTAEQPKGVPYKEPAERQALRQALTLLDKDEVSQNALRSLGFSASELRAALR